MNGTATDIPLGDRLDILDLYARQSHAVDAAHGELWAATFTEDGVFESPTYGLTARGRRELADFARMSNKTAEGRGERFRHRVSEIVLTRVGDDRVDVVAYLMITATGTEGTRIDRSLVTHDALRKVDHRWLVQSRQTFRD